MEKGPSRSALSKLGVGAVFRLAGGAALAVMGALPPFIAAIAGGAVAVLGLVGLSSRDKDDKKIGTALVLGGAATVLSRFGVIPLVKSISWTALRFGSVALIGLGVWSLVRFVIGLKKRS
jgi:hypothetical protein